jgi:phosphoglycolate phosphatase-like HAD superfamily hydrolase
MTDAVLFDFDGTLFFGTARLNVHCFSRVLEAMGRPPLTGADWTVGLTLPDICQRLLGGASDDIVQPFARSVMSFVPEYIEANVQPDPVLTDMLRRLSGVARLAVVSNADEAYLEPMLAALGVRRLFDRVWAHRPGYSKAVAILEVLGDLGARRAVMVGDRAEDVEAGRINGLMTIGIRNPAFPDEVSSADRVVENHRQMGRAVCALLKRGG